MPALGKSAVIFFDKFVTAGQILDGRDVVVLHTLFKVNTAEKVGRLICGKRDFNLFCKVVFLYDILKFNAFFLADCAVKFVHQIFHFKL